MKKINMFILSMLAMGNAYAVQTAAPMTTMRAKAYVRIANTDLYVQELKSFEQKMTEELGKLSREDTIKRLASPDSSNIVPDFERWLNKGFQMPMKEGSVIEIYDELARAQLEAYKLFSGMMSLIRQLHKEQK